MSTGRPDDVELISHGREPRRRRPGRVPRQLTPAARAVAAVSLCLLVVVAGGLAWRASARQQAASAVVARAARSFTAAPPARLPAPQSVQVRISTADQRAYVTGRGQVDLALQLVNDGDHPVELLDAQLPQAGVRTDGSLALAPGGAAVLEPGTATPVGLHLLVECPRAVTGPAADHLQLTVADSGGAPRGAALDLRPLPGFWDRVRHSACAAEALTVTAQPTSVRWQGGTTNG